MNDEPARPAPSPAPRPVAGFLSRPEFRLALLGLAGVAAIYFGFIGLDVETAGMLVKLYGYYVMLLTFVLWVWALWCLWQRRLPGAAPDGRELLGAGAVIGVFSLMAITAEPFRS
ncbi:MAG TPA: hypothetical protein VMB21_18695, partial [Candidatus Limnocylindria bacterium]|nr:hypothetical protein [Candidatus Limnocylindria bacterium]